MTAAVSEAAYQLQCCAGGNEPAENSDYGFSKCYGASSPESFEKT